MRNLKVYYGLIKLTEKAVKKPSILVAFEDESSPLNEDWISRRMKILHIREQTKMESLDSKKSNRMFTFFEMFFLHDKRFKNSPELAIQHNFNADSNNVSFEERTIIAQKIRSEIYKFYNIFEPNEIQLTLF